MVGSMRWMMALSLAAVLSCGGGDGNGVDANGNPGSDNPDAAEVDGGNGKEPDAAPVDCEMRPCRYVRAGADPGGDGSTWASAFPALPETLERGAVYYVAAGDYPGYVFDDPAEDSSTIQVVKATAADHGATEGWQDTYAEGPAVFGPVELAAPGYVIDGRGRGIVVRGSFQGTVVSIRAGDQVLRSLDIDGAFALGSNDQHAEGACTGLDASGAADVTIADSEIHDVADDGAVFSGVTELAFEGNVVHRLFGCGTDGGCGPCFNGHSDGLELFDVEHSAIRGNLIYDVRSTATVFFGNWGGPDEYVEDLTIENNLFYGPEVGLVAYIHYARDIRVLHNVFWGRRQGSYGGLSIGPEVEGLALYNNIILSINTEHTGGAYDPAQHASDYNLIGVDVGQWPVGEHDIVAADPAFSAIPAIDGEPVTDPPADAFSLNAQSPALNAGATAEQLGDLPLPTTDFFGNPRSSPPDLGALERIE